MKEPIREWELEALAHRVERTSGSHSGNQVKSLGDEVLAYRRFAELVRLPYLEKKKLHEFTRQLARVAAEETDVETKIAQAEVLRVLCRVLEAQEALANLSGLPAPAKDAN